MAGVAGLVFTGLFLASFILMRLALGHSIGTDRPVGSTLAERLDLAVAALYLMPFAGVAFLWFIAVVRNQIGEREDRFFATAFLGSGLLFVAMLFAGAATVGALVAARSEGAGLLGNQATDEFGRALGYALLFVYSTKAAGVFVLTTSTIVRVLPGWPRWMALMGYAIGLSLLLSVTYWEPILLLFPLWVTVVSVRILRS
jgi:hypothetical protein